MIKLGEQSSSHPVIQSSPLKIAHRGASGHFPENTMLAYREALGMGADGFEFDVRVCKSGEVVVFHDDTLERTTDGKGRVDAHSLDELKRLSAGAGEKIPTLAELLAEFSGRLRLFVELKDAACMREVVRLVAQHGNFEQTPLISFHPEWLLEAKSIEPRLRIGATPPYDRPLDLNYPQWAASEGFSAVSPCIDLLTEEFAATARAHGLALYTWTANTPEKISLAKRLGVDGIMSDYLELL